MVFRVNYITFARDVQLHINNKDYGQIKCIFREEGECQGRENQCLVQVTGGEVAEGQRKRSIRLFRQRHPRWSDDDLRDLAKRGSAESPHGYRAFHLSGSKD